MMVHDLIDVERELGFRYEMPATARHYQEICPRCRRALFGLAQGATVASAGRSGLRPHELTIDGDAFPHDELQASSSGSGRILGR